MLFIIFKDICSHFIVALFLVRGVNLFILALFGKKNEWKRVEDSGCCAAW